MWIFRKINRYIVGQKLKKSFGRRFQQDFLNYAQISSCLLVCAIDKDEDFEKISELESNLKADNIDVTLLCYVRRKKSAIEHSFNRLIITKKELSVVGKPVEGLLQNLRNKTFDIVFDISPKSYVPLLYALSEVRALQYCGTDRNRNLPYNFVIEVSNKPDADESYVLEQMRFYLRNINKPTV